MSKRLRTFQRIELIQRKTAKSPIFILYITLMHGRKLFHHNLIGKNPGRISGP